MTPQEGFFSGYCRQTDAGRTVMVEDGEADCLYPDCPYSANCPIAQKLRAFLEDG